YRLHRERDLEERGSLKLIEDGHGLLAHAPRNVAACVGEVVDVDSVGKLGADVPQQIARLLERLLLRLDAPVFIGALRVDVSLVATKPFNELHDAATDAALIPFLDELLKRADTELSCLSEQLFCFLVVALLLRLLGLLL